MIRKLFASPALYATLSLFFDYPADPLFPRLIVRYTRTDIKGVLRELKKLEEIGIIRSRRAGRRTRYRRNYRLNEDFLLYEELTSIFEKTRERRRCAARSRLDAGAWRLANAPEAADDAPGPVAAD